jgi:hypothetical protein
MLNRPPNPQNRPDPQLSGGPWRNVFSGFDLRRTYSAGFCRRGASLGAMFDRDNPIVLMGLCFVTRPVLR